MKKLIIAAFAVAFAAVANAAAITWNSGAITMADGITTAGAGSVTAYLFSVDKADYDAFSGITDGKTLSDKVWESYGSKLSDATVNADSVKKGSKANLTDTKDYSAGDSAYAVILYVDKAEQPNYMANVGTYKFDSASDWSVDSMASYIGGTGAATSWSTAVPEPTSGLLLLLGMAGLALKRKHA